MSLRERGRAIQDHSEKIRERCVRRELPGVPVINSGGRCVGIITEADLVMAGEDADLHLPHYFELFGGFVFLESLSHVEERLRRLDLWDDAVARTLSRPVAG